MLVAFARTPKKSRTKTRIKKKGIRIMRIPFFFIGNGPSGTPVPTVFDKFYCIFRVFRSAKFRQLCQLSIAIP